MREFQSGATRDSEEGKLDYFGFISPVALTQFAKYMHQHRKQADGVLRNSDNWKKGIPEDAYRRSLIRHMVDLWAVLEQDGDPTELLCAVWFNVQGLLYERHKEITLAAGEGCQ